MYLFSSWIFFLIALFISIILMNSGMPFSFFSSLYLSLFIPFSIFTRNSLSSPPFFLITYFFRYPFISGLIFSFSYFRSNCKFAYDPNYDIFLTFLSNPFFSSYCLIDVTVFFLLGTYFTFFSFSTSNSNSKLSLLSLFFSS